MIRWQCNGTFHTPSLFQISRSNSIGSSAINPTPLADITSYAVNCNQTSVATILCLLLSSSPPQVAFFVMPIIINAVNRVTFVGAVAYFGIKFFKGIKQTFNATSAIIRKQFVTRIVTSFANALIDSVFATLTHTVAFTNYAYGFFAQAAARCTATVQKAIYINFAFCSAYAPRAPFITVATGYDRPSSKSLIYF